MANRMHTHALIKRTNDMDDAIARFWDNYISKTITCNLPSQSRRWYVKHIEAYIKANPNRRLADASPEDLRLYLLKIGRKPEYPDWRFRQVADALRILYKELIKPEYAMLEGAISGRALYDGRIDPAEALAILKSD